jgi:MFS family permease
VLTQTLSWHAVFWVNVPIGLIAAALTLLRLDESFGPRGNLDLIAAGLVAGGAVGVVLGLVRAASVGWGQPGTLLSLVLGLACMAAFVGWELRASEPMLPMRLFRSVTFSAANATSFFMSGAQFAAAFLIAQYLQLALGNGPLTTGLLVLPWTMTPLFVAPIAGSLSDRIGRRPLMLIGMLLQAVGFLAFAMLAGVDASYARMIVPLIVAGIGVSMVLPVAPAAALGAVEMADTGRASAVNSTLQRFGTAFGVAIATAVFAANGSIASPARFTDGLRPALAAVAALSVLGALSALFVWQRRIARLHADAEFVEMDLELAA